MGFGVDWKRERRCKGSEYPRGSEERVIEIEPHWLGQMAHIRLGDEADDRL